MAVSCPKTSPIRPTASSFAGAVTWGGPRGIRRVSLAARSCALCGEIDARRVLVLSDVEDPVGMKEGLGPCMSRKNKRSTLCADDGLPRLGWA